ncbi:Endoribonuclease L-PSP/chorismate mutase-like protein [Aspergillus recurvatus]
MPHFTWTWIPAGADEALPNPHAYNRAVRVENIHHLSGQVTFRGLGHANAGARQFRLNQIDKAFANIDAILRAAGGKGWSQAHKVRSYHVDQAQDSMVRNFTKWMPEHRPLWTCVQVGRLAGDGMKVDIEVEAYVPVGASELNA